MSFLDHRVAQRTWKQRSTAIRLVPLRIKLLGREGRSRRPPRCFLVAAIAESRTQVEGQACDQDERECRDNGRNQGGNRSERDKAANEEAGRKTVEAPAAAPPRRSAARGPGLRGGYESEAETDKRNDKRYESGSDGDVERVSEAD
jgi:hypothetical protein